MQVAENAGALGLAKVQHHTQNPPGFGPWGFDSHSRHQSNPHQGKLVRKGSGICCNLDIARFWCNSARVLPEIGRGGLFDRRSIPLLIRLDSSRGIRDVRVRDDVITVEYAAGLVYFVCLKELSVSVKTKTSQT
jgi:hypothetical protein